MAGATELQQAKDLAENMRGKPYQIGAVRADAADSSGLISILINCLQGEKDYYQRCLTTRNLPDRAGELGLLEGLGDENDFNIGVIYPSESRSGFGHIAGTLGGLNVESRAGRGVLIGERARGARSPLFRHHFHMPIEDPKTDAKLSRPQLRLVHPYPGHAHHKDSFAHGHIRTIKQRLNALAGPGGHEILDGQQLSEDGNFDENTRQIIEAFQRNRGMKADGIVGPLTWVRLFHR